MLRKARLSDIDGMMHLRLQVTENILSDPSVITKEMVVDSITAAGRGWVFEEKGQLLGFSIAMDEDPSIWAMFVLPGHERKGIGRLLLESAVAWLWSRGAGSIWLETDSGTRAEGFYRKHGWQEISRGDEGDIRFELQRSDHSSL